MKTDLNIFTEWYSRMTLQSIGAMRALQELWGSGTTTPVQIKDALKEMDASEKFLGRLVRQAADPAKLAAIRINMKPIEKLLEESNKRLDQIASGTYNRKEIKRALLEFVNEMRLTLSKSDDRG